MRPLSGILVSFRRAGTHGLYRRAGLRPSPPAPKGGEDFIWSKLLVRRQCHFLTSAIQFCTTVNGVRPVSSAIVTNKNRCPSLAFA